MEIVFKCRASAAGKIMTNPQGKSNLDKYNEAVDKLSKLKSRYDGFVKKESKTATDILNNQIPKTEFLIQQLEPKRFVKELSETCKQHLREWIIEYKYKRHKEFGSKFTDKGNQTEQDGFQLIQDVRFKGKLLLKFKEQLEDEYFTGNPDLAFDDLIIDNKSSWNLFTFPIGEIEPPDKGNEPQVRVYMRLAKKQKALVCYTLNNSPIKTIEDECRKWCNNKGIIDYSNIPDDKAYEICKNHAFTKEFMKELSFIYGRNDLSKFIEIPKEKRLVSFEYQRDLEIENSMIERVLECRKWVDENWDKF